MNIFTLFGLLLAPTLLAGPAPAPEAAAAPLSLPDAASFEGLLSPELAKRGCTLKLGLIISKAQGYFGPNRPSWVVENTFDQRCNNAGCSTNQLQYSFAPFVLNVTIGTYNFGPNNAATLVTAYKYALSSIYQQTQTSHVSGSTTYWNGPQYVGLKQDVDCDGTIIPASVLNFNTNAFRVGDGGWCDSNNLVSVVNNAKAYPNYFSTYALYPASSYNCDPYVISYT
ncbi:uncharacterized protein LOC62_01G001743 [Vanrija pseudolonga]|uniref:Uncharacterized protein n=1 Tax=Vanrija pseudolonga TaxID=143232 RepID=A0AAF1BNJ9_9TREE|nr:hypothetical protein LOC62_01G001743 [Vanrija pseudolonga]